MKKKMKEDAVVAPAPNPGMTTTADIADYPMRMGMGRRQKMPNATVKAFAKKSMKTPGEVEKMWNSIVDSMKKKHDESEKDFYPMVVAALKKALKIEGDAGLANKIKKNLQEE